MFGLRVYLAWTPQDLSVFVTMVVGSCSPRDGVNFYIIFKRSLAFAMIMVAMPLIGTVTMVKVIVEVTAGISPSLVIITCSVVDTTTVVTALVVGRVVGVQCVVQTVAVFPSHIVSVCIILSGRKQLLDRN